MAGSRWLISGLIAIPLALLTTERIGSSASNTTPAQQHVSHADDAMNVKPGDDRVLIGPEFLPRRSDLSNKLIVPAGQVVELPADATYDYIEVAGTLRASRAHDTTTRFTHLVVLPRGYLDVGTQSDPIPCDRTVNFIVRDQPIDTTRDPFQWGNGLVNFGRQTRVGCSNTAWVESAGSIPSGATTIALATSPSGWRAGDELLIPDTAAPASKADPRRESKVTIAAVEGARLTLSKPLDFEHDEIKDPNGILVIRPRVANLTRNIVIRSENPDGVRGHTADVGRGASWDIRYNLLIGLGRTRRVPFDTVLGSHVGTNQRGKYAEHHHHVQSAPTSSDVGNVYNGLGGGKWGLVTHDTSDTLIERNIAVDFPGAGFITEDGYEVRNVFRSNFAAYSLGRTPALYGGFYDAKNDVDVNCPGCEGTGFWLRGIMNAFENNEAWNNYTAGINLFNQQQPDGKYPGVRGGEPDSALKHYTDQPLSFTGNVVAANYFHGFEVWGVTRFPYQNLVAAHNTIRQVMGIISEHIELYLVNPTLICAVGKGGIGVHSANGYVSSFRIDQGRIAGCQAGVSGGGSGKGITLVGTVLQNEINIDEMWTGPMLFENVMHVPLANYPHQYVHFGNGTTWNGSDPLPRAGGSLWIPQRGSRIVVKNWQGTGKDYRLFFRQSLASNPAWYSAPGPHILNSPVRGLTNQESWDRYGMSFAGDVLKESEAIHLDGLVNGLAREGLSVPFGPPRAVVTYPTMRASAAVEGGGFVRIYALLTGDPDAASSVMMFSVDNERPQAVEQREVLDERTFGTNHIAPGIHTVKVWRTQKNDKSKAVPGSEYTSQYCIGPCPTIPHGHITLSPLTSTPNTTAGGAAVQAYTILNSGAAESFWTASTSHDALCKLNGYNGRLGAGESTTLKAWLNAPLKDGSACTVTIVDSNADNSPQRITVNYVGVVSR